MAERRQRPTAALRCNLRIGGTAGLSRDKATRPIASRMRGKNNSSETIVEKVEEHVL